MLPLEEAGERGGSSPEKANGMSAFPSCRLGVSASTGFWWIYFMVLISERVGGADCWEKQVEDVVGPFRV